MTGGIEAAGDIVTGGLIARAVDPQTGTAEAGDEKNCLNCGTTLIGSYCHACGQKGHVHRTLRAFFHDILHGVLHFEGKIWGTVPLLFWKPGDLTRRYVHGERARFVSPLALFLFSVFLMFAVLGFLGRHLETSANGPMGSEAAKGVKSSSEELRAEIEKIDSKIKAAEAKGQDTSELKRERVNVQGVLRIMEGGPSVLTKDDGEGVLGFKTGWPRLDKGIEKANENPNLLLYKLQSNAYKFSWALIPISIPFVWLLFFWRRQFKMYDHAIFVTYSLCFMTLFGVLLTIAGAIGVATGILAVTFMILAPIHIYKQMKGAYSLSRTSALVRTVVLLNMTFVVLTFFVLLLLALGVMG